jgi:hypothetical protein
MCIRLVKRVYGKFLQAIASAIYTIRANYLALRVI